MGNTRHQCLRSWGRNEQWVYSLFHLFTSDQTQVGEHDPTSRQEDWTLRQSSIHPGIDRLRRGLYLLSRGTILQQTGPHQSFGLTGLGLISVVSQFHPQSQEQAESHKHLLWFLKPLNVPKHLVGGLTPTYRSTGVGVSVQKETTVPSPQASLAQSPTRGKGVGLISGR